MNNQIQILKEVSALSASFEARLDRYIGEFNDDLTRYQITEELRAYITEVRKLIPINVDLSKIGLSELSPYNHGEVVPNDYTLTTFKSISRMLADMS